MWQLPPANDAYANRLVFPVLKYFAFFPGAQIIDLMMLVIDITKGVQTQTAECLVIGEILCPKLIVVLNKIDQVPEGKREQVIEKVISVKTFKSSSLNFYPRFKYSIVISTWTLLN